MMSVDDLLDDLAAYVDKPETSCFSLPPDAYLSAEPHALEVREIFEKSWLCVGRDEYVPEPGDYFTIDVLDEPMVIVCGNDGVVRALNVSCRHRFMPLVEGRGNARTFVCPYHAWSYANDGRLLGAPHMEGSDVFDKASCRRTGWRVGRDSCSSTSTTMSPRSRSKSVRWIVSRATIG